MSRRNTQENDSLDMLLDTLCNTFGIIILIALLVAVLAFQNRPVEVEMEIETLSRELIERRLSRVESDLEQARQRQAELLTDLEVEELAEARSLIEEQRELESLFDAVHEELDGARTSLQQFERIEREDPGEILNELQRQADQFELARAKVDNALAASREHLDHLEARNTELATQLSEAEAHRKRHFRLPRERHEARMEHLYVFVRYGEIFPHYSFSRGFPNLNSYGIRWIKYGGGSEICEPIRGRGLNLETDRENYLRFIETVPRNYYLSFIVWPDSFAAFGEAKQIAVDRGRDFSWEPVQPGVLIIFGSDGSPPPPPL